MFLLLFFSNQYTVIDATSETFIIITGESLISNGSRMLERQVQDSLVSQRFEELFLNILTH